jgi:2,3-dihydroxy-p-cumate/2,3-dihydroxybenzoate 3,4-dioxygenase
MKLRSIELVVPDPSSAAEFLVDIWGLASGEQRDGTLYLRGSGPAPYLVALAPGESEFVRSTTFVCSDAELVRLRASVAAAGWPARAVHSDDPGGGSGIVTELPDGTILRFLAGAQDVAPIEGFARATRRVRPVALTHVVFNAADAEAMADAAENVLGFRVSDRTRGMVFVRCNDSHHSTAFARAGFTSLNHIAFEMEDLDAVMRGIGYMRDHGYEPAWGPGRHGPGDNVYAYYIAPFGAVIEYSTAVEKVPEDYRAGEPDDWTWPEKRIDQWGISEKKFDELRRAEERFRCHREWEPEVLD